MQRWSECNRCWHAFGQSGLVVMVVLLVGACGGLAQGPTRFQGASGGVRVGAHDVKDFLVMPEGYEVQGEVSVRCSSHSRSDALGAFNTWGSCDTARLIRSLREKVSRVGGEGMVGRRCDSDVDETTGFDDKPVRTEKIVCRAAVVRRANIEPLPAPPTVASSPPVPPPQPKRAVRARTRTQPQAHGCQSLPCAL